MKPSASQTFIRCSQLFCTQLTKSYVHGRFANHPYTAHHFPEFCEANLQVFIAQCIANKHDIIVRWQIMNIYGSSLLLNFAAGSPYNVFILQFYCMNKRIPQKRLLNVTQVTVGCRIGQVVYQLQRSLHYLLK